MATLLLLSLIQAEFKDSTIDSLFQRADRFIVEEDYQSALFELKNLNEILDEAPLVLQKMLGYCYLELNELDNATQYYKNAISQDSTAYGLEGMYYNIACIHFRKNDIDLGLQYLEKAFLNGYLDYNHLLIDEDMALITLDTNYTNLKEKYLEAIGDIADFMLEIKEEVKKPEYIFKGQELKLRSSFVDFMSFEEKNIEMKIFRWCLLMIL